MSMCKWLAFQLYGPMASWGGIAVGGVRPTYNHPTRSAVVGLISAALGIKREEEELLLRVSRGYHVAFRVNDSGPLIRDYHTMTAVKPQYKKTTQNTSLKDALKVPAHELETTLSYRDYLCDSSYSVFITEADAPASLEELRDFLLEPIFTLFLGRMSCPLALPMNPRVFEADTLKDACASYPGFFLSQKKQPVLSVFWEDGINAGVRGHRSETRRDLLRSRKKGQYCDRVEYCGVVEGG